jgi:hypothetical protein
MHQTLNMVDGIVDSCALTGTITLSGIANAIFKNCTDAIPGDTPPEINMGGSGSGLSLANYNGSILISNLTGSDEASVSLNAGRIVIDATVSNGTITCDGVGRLENNSTGTAVVVDRLISHEDVRLIKQMTAGNITITGTDPFLLTVLDEDNVTTLATFNVSSDGRTRTRLT